MLDVTTEISILCLEYRRWCVIVSDVERYLVIRKLVDCIFNLDGSRNRHIGDLVEHTGLLFYNGGYSSCDVPTKMMYTKWKRRILPTQCICVFCMVLTINSDCFPKQH
jgi:hypothetical protein